jgi:hypothetical protein
MMGHVIKIWAGAQTADEFSALLYHREGPCANPDPGSKMNKSDPYT